MSELYIGKKIRITDETLDIGGTSYPTRTISSISNPIKSAPSLKQMGFGILLVVGGLWSISQFTIELIFLGVALASFGAWIAKDEWETTHSMYVEFSNGKEVRIEVDSEDQIKEIRDSLYEAMK